jgi:hypothetical protein
MENEESKVSASDVRRHLKCYVRKIELVEGEYPRIDISVDVMAGDTIDKSVAELLHLGYAEVSQ